MVISFQIILEDFKKAISLQEYMLDYPMIREG